MPHDRHSIKFYNEKFVLGHFVTYGRMKSVNLVITSLPYNMEFKNVEMEIIGSRPNSWEEFSTNILVHLVDNWPIARIFPYSLIVLKEFFRVFGFSFYNVS